MSVTKVKKMAAEFALEQTVRQIAANPEKNLPRLLTFAEKLAVYPGHKENIRRLRDRIEGDPLITTQARRFAINAKMISNFMINWAANSIMTGRSVREAYAEELGVHVPDAILIDPTAGCNLQCSGCWAGEYDQAESLEPALIHRVIDEAKKLGIYWIIFSGGEPFCYPGLMDIVEKHPEVGFMAYTNGTLIDDETADRLKEAANFTLAFSLEGFKEETDARRSEGTFDKIMQAMDLLAERGVFFGASLTTTKDNVDILFSDEFIDFLVEKGVLYIWNFHYMPIGRKPSTDLMISAKQRRFLAERVPQLRSEKPVMIIDFWNDGEHPGGCIAGGRLYLHINASGGVEPCAFVHFSTTNIREVSLKEALKNPLFCEFQHRQPFSSNHLAPCPIIDNPRALREMVKKTGAVPTHPGANELLGEKIASELDQKAAAWHKEAAAIKRQKKRETSAGL